MALGKFKLSLKDYEIVGTPPLWEMILVKNKQTNKKSLNSTANLTLEHSLIGHQQKFTFTSQDPTGSYQGS